MCMSTNYVSVYYRFIRFVLDVRINYRVGRKVSRMMTRV